MCPMSTVHAPVRPARAEQIEVGGRRSSASSCRWTHHDGSCFGKAADAGASIAMLRTVALRMRCRWESSASFRPGTSLEAAGLERFDLSTGACIFPARDLPASTARSPADGGAPIRG
jgi:hypothetical protein